MREAEALIQDYYGGRGDLLQRILAALDTAGVDPRRPQPGDLYAFDQLHSRGIVATREHAERAGIAAGMRVLDLGCGLGGCARYLAAERGCKVIGIDLTPEFIATARELTARCGLGSRVEFRAANALRLPFPDESFDHVFSHNVTMNIADKQKLCCEVARVLKKGSRFSCSEMARGPGGPLIFPLPWASDEATSFLATPDEMRQAIETSGLHVVQQIDLSDVSRAALREADHRAARGDPPLQLNRLVMGDTFLAERMLNAARCVMEGRTAEQLVVAEKQ